MGKKEGITLFISYSHEDDEYKRQLINHLSGLIDSGRIKEWHDKKIIAGEDWDKRISEKLLSSKIILLLISASFIGSDYCKNVEVKEAIERHHKGEARVIPIIVRPCCWGKMPFGKIQVLPSKGIALTKWTDIDEGYVDVVKGIEKVVNELHADTIKSFYPGQYLSTDEVISDDLILKLNREIQNAYFQESLIKSKEKALLYFILGEEEQHPYSFYQRIYTEEFQHNKGGVFFARKPIILESADNEERAKIDFLGKLFDIFDLSLNEFYEDEWRLECLVESRRIKDSRYKKIFIGVNLYCEEWKSYVINILSWFSEKFCRSYIRNESHNNPRFIFFFHLIYNDQHTEYDTQTIGEVYEHEIEESLKKIPQVILLPKLGMITKLHIEKWLDHVIPDCKKRDKYLEKFSNAGKFTWSAARQRLEEICMDHNNMIQGGYKDD
jgi:hypothetical protein